jgi:hypothetical protein
MTAAVLSGVDWRGCEDERREHGRRCEDLGDVHKVSEG